jgi:hypothetical protein
MQNILKTVNTFYCLWPQPHGKLNLHLKLHLKCTHTQQTAEDSGPVLPKKNTKYPSNVQHAATITTRKTTS